MRLCQVDAISNLLLFIVTAILKPSNSKVSIFGLTIIKTFNFNTLYFVILITTIFIYIFHDTKNYSFYYIKSFFDPNIPIRKNKLFQNIISFIPIITSIIILLCHKSFKDPSISINQTGMLTLIFAIIAALSADKKEITNQLYLGENLAAHLSYSSFINEVTDTNYYKIYFSYIITFPCFLLIFNINKLSSIYSKYLYYLWQSSLIYIIFAIITVILSDSHIHNVINRINSGNTNIKKIKYKLNKSINHKFQVLIKIDLCNQDTTHYLKSVLETDFYRIINTKNKPTNLLNGNIINQEASLISILFQSLVDTFKTNNESFKNICIIHEFKDINSTINNINSFSFDINNLSIILNLQFKLLKIILKKDEHTFTTIFIKNYNYQKYIIPNFIYTKLRYYNQWYQLNRILFVKYHCCKSFINSHKLRGTNIFKIVKRCYQNFINEECSFISSTYGLSLDTNQQSISLILSLKKIIPKYFNEYCKKKEKNIFIIAKDHNSSHNKNE